MSELRAGRRRLLWTLALLITLFSAWFQRTTGPSYPISGSIQIAGETIDYSLDRTHGGDGDQPVHIAHPQGLPGGRLRATLLWRRHGLDGSWMEVPMQLEGTGDGGMQLTAALPHQPPAGKLDYRVRLGEVRVRSGGIIVDEATVTIPEQGFVITRFKGSVPAAALIPHILLMFVGMLWSTRAGLEALYGGPFAGGQSVTALLLLMSGGMILGPVVQYYAFGSFWTGVPFGWDLTDNKTLISVAAWAWAVWARRGGRTAKWPVVAAALLTLAVYLIPHSVLGSELDYAALSAPDIP